MAQDKNLLERLMDILDALGVTASGNDDEVIKEYFRQVLTGCQTPTEPETEVLEGKGAESEAKPMWAVFSTVDMDNNQATYEDFFTIVETKAQAIAAYNERIEDPKTYAAGYAPIAGGTEPHWMDGGE